MFKYRKKPVVVEAFQLPLSGVLADIAHDLPKWFIRALLDGKITQAPRAPGIVITTFEGDMRGVAGDWIIRGIKGELYPCKPDIFAATHEAVTED